MRIEIAFILLSFSLFGQWGSADQAILRDIRSNQYDTLDYMYEFMNGYSPTGSAGYNFGWKDYSKNMYLTLKEIQDGNKYEYRVYDGVETNTLVDQQIYSERNLTAFDLSQYAGDNTEFYGNNILSYYPENHNISINNNTPDALFLNYPEYGNMMIKIGQKMTTEGFGINDIKNSQQTEEIRTEVDTVKTKMEGMISSNYNNSYFNYDFSEIGNFFVRAHIMSTNPWVNLKGRINIKPDVNDLHYNIWHTYFDRSYSGYAIALKYAIHTVMFLMFTVYVINDVMSIVSA